MIHDEQVHFKEIQYNSSDYQAELLLRDKMLRQPLNMSLFDEDLSRDANDIHIAAFFENKLIGCALLSPLSDTEVKMRQVAIETNYQSKKIGSKMMAYCEKLLQNKGYRKIALNARKNALNFYKKNNYQVLGDEFVEVGIPHYKMQKLL